MTEKAAHSENSGENTILGDPREALHPIELSEKQNELKQPQLKKSKSSGTNAVAIPVVDQLVDEYEGLTEAEKKIVVEQIHFDKRDSVSVLELFRYHSTYEHIANIIGLVAAIAAGAAQPLMTIVFGNLTSAFVSYQTTVQFNGTAEAIAAARHVLNKEVNKDALYLVYIGAGMLGATYIYMVTWIITGENATKRVRENYFRAAMRQNIAFFDKLAPGEITTRIETDTHLIQEGVSEKFVITLFFIAMFVAGFIIAYIKNWRLALAISTVIPCIALSGGMMQHYMTKYKTLGLAETSKGANIVEESITSIRNTTAFSIQNVLAKLYDIPNIKANVFGAKGAVTNSISLAAMFFVIYGSYGLAFYYGTTLILQGRANAGEIVNVFFAILIGSFSLAMMAPNLQALAQAQSAAGVIFSTIDRVPVIDSLSTAGATPSSTKGHIELKDVHFVYPARPAARILKGMNLVFSPGKMTALVGASGSGKSTIIGLVERFYDPIGGEVLLDGIPVKDLQIKWLRSQIGLVSQEPTLFAVTVLENIRYGLFNTPKADLPMEEQRALCVEAAKMANAHTFIEGLPEQYETSIGERGMLLSGGQKQRIAIARAIVANPPILLLDEATSALDTASESIVQDALDKASLGRTTIAIAHRLSTIRDSDQIVVMERGEIIEIGQSAGGLRAHDILLKNEGPYSKLVTAQQIREAQEATSADDDEAEAEAIAEAQGEALKLKRTGTGRSAASEALERKLANGEGVANYSLLSVAARMFVINKDQWPKYVIGSIAAIGSGAVYPVFGIIFGGMIGAFSLIDRHELRHQGNLHGLYCLIVAIVATIFVIFQNYMFGVTVERLSQRLRLMTYQSILKQDIEFFDKDENSVGSLTAMVTDRAQKVNGLLGVTAGVILQSISTLVVGSIIGIAYTWRIGLVGFALIPLTICAGLVRLRVVVLKDQKNKAAHEKSAQMACEAANAIRTVASLTREEDCQMIYQHQLDGPSRKSNLSALWSNVYYSISQALVFWILALVFWWGCKNLVEGHVDSKEFFIAMISIVFGSTQAGNVFNFVPDMSNGRSAANDILTLHQSQPDMDIDRPGGSTSAVSGKIEFKNVHFRYPTRPHVRVLRGLSLEILPGQFAAFVGPSGCGKSTTIQLVERFYDPLAGSVVVDGEDLLDRNVADYRSSVGLVSQEPMLYSGTIRYNIELGSPTPVTQEQIEEACKSANIHNFIMTLPDGYDTDVGGKGSQLSGGQKQRIAIARALIRNPKILLLDEATSALDSESEKIVQAALDKAAAGRTTISIAHRLSTIQNADVIFVLNDGRVAEKGKHDELINLKGIYFELVNQQNLSGH